MTTTHGFQNRATAYLQAAAARGARLYDADGKWIANAPPREVRERYWLSFALYAAGKNALADAVIRGGDLRVSHMGEHRVDNSTFDIFHSNIAVMCLKLHGSAMADDVRARLTRLVQEAIGSGGGDRGADYQFHGYNDNMPAKAAMGLILGGEMLGDARAVAHGLSNLRGLRAMLIRRGTISEYNSPTYSSATLPALAKIAEHAQSEEARDIARKAEERLWIDLAARFHPEMGCIAGPYSRAYTIDLLATVTGVSALLWFVLGDISKPSPMVLFDPDPDLVVHHAGDYPFNIAQMCWVASASYHVPETAARLFERKSYPFHAVASYEIGDAGPDFPARADTIVSHLQPDYTLGTAGTGWLDGVQCESYFVTYKQARDVRSYKDIGTVFTKLVINDEVPGFVPETACSSSGEDDLLRSHSGSLTVQSESTALVLTHPHLSLGGPADGIGAEPAPLSRLSEMVLFPAHHAGANEILAGAEHRGDWSGNVASGDWIVCRRGRLLIAILPIAYSRDFGQAEIRLERINEYEVIRATFYQGETRRFTRDELRHVFGGFIAEHASVDEYPSLEAFAAELRAGVATDFVYTTRRSRYIRPRTSARPALDLETSWSPGARQERFVSINGRAAETVRLRIDGIDELKLPFLNEAVPSTATHPLPFAPFPISWKSE